MVTLKISLPYKVTDLDRAQLPPCKEDRLLTLHLIREAVAAKNNGKLKGAEGKINGRLMNDIATAIKDNKQEIEVSELAFEQTRKALEDWEYPNVFSGHVIVLMQHVDEIYERLKKKSKDAEDKSEEPEKSEDTDKSVIKKKKKT